VREDHSIIRRDACHHATTWITIATTVPAARAVRLVIANNVNQFHQAAGGGLGCAHPSADPGKWTPRERAALSNSPPSRSFAQASPGVWITLFSPRSLSRLVQSPFSAPQPQGADMGQLILKRASASRSSGEWRDDDYDVLADGVLVGRIFNAAASPVVRCGCGRCSVASTRTARRRTALRRRARLRWQRSRRAGRGCEAFLTLGVKQAKIDGLWAAIARGGGVVREQLLTHPRCCAADRPTDMQCARARGNTAIL
jgi:hypothetical protein